MGVSHFAWIKNGDQADGLADGHRITTYEYDDCDRVSLVADTANRVWEFAYDQFDRLVQTTDPTGRSRIASYDG